MKADTKAILQARDFARCLGERFPHVLQVESLAQALFDTLAKCQLVQDADCEILRAAALLHDIGYLTAPDGHAHHIHSENFILQKSWPGWNKSTIRSCACVARLHRKKVKAAELYDSGFTPAECEKIFRLAAILRVADSLDRSHTQSIQKITLLNHSVKRWEIIIKEGCPDPEDIFGFHKKNDLWRAIYGEISLATA